MSAGLRQNPNLGEPVAGVGLVLETVAGQAALGWFVRWLAALFHFWGNSTFGYIERPRYSVG